MDEELFESLDVDEESNYSYPVLDQDNNIITNPDLTLGYLKKEHFTIHHGSIPEQWHYKVVSFEFANGEVYKPTDNDAHVRVVDEQKGIFKYINLDGEEKQLVTSQIIAPVVDRPMQVAWDETKTIYRYVLYTEQELAEKSFLANGPALLAEAYETIDELVLVLADLLGGEEIE